MSANDNSPPKRPRKALRRRVCPICGKPRSVRYGPFCSKRCADVDLHRWLRGGYVIPGADPSAEPDGGAEDNGE
jgi:endogenous inhibitor of DNA gyrase (YacG/DUF329 family)